MTSIAPADPPQAGGALADDLPHNGRLGHNIVHFARALRRAGLPIGPGRVLDAVRAVSLAGFSSRDDFFWTLQACFVSRPEEREVFAQVFRLFWRDPKYLEHIMALVAPMMRGLQDEKPAGAATRRAVEGLLHGVEPLPDAPRPAEEIEIEIDASATASADERLRHLDFEQMTVAEMAAAERMLSRLMLPPPPGISRRSIALPGPLPDWRRTMRQSLRHGGELRVLATRRPRPRKPDLVMICDISGSMSRYSRALLHFTHAVAGRKTQGWGRVHAFTFGTRLTNVTRHLARRDVDAALAAAGAAAGDWSGGTRIASCLREFNRDWSRRVLGAGAVVVLVTDGLDRDPEGGLSAVMERLALSCDRVIWLNPLLRWEGFVPRARGIREMLPHVSSLRAGHDIAALEGLAAALSQREDGGEKARAMALMRASAPVVIA